MTCLQPQYRGGGPWRILAAHHPANLAHEWAPGWVRDLSHKKVENNWGRHPTLTCDLHTCTHVNIYSHTQYTLGRGILMCTISLSFSFFPFFPFLLFFLFPSFFFLHLSSFLFFISFFFWQNVFFFLSRPNWSQTLNSPASPPPLPVCESRHQPQASQLPACMQ